MLRIAINVQIPVLKIIALILSEAALLLKNFRMIRTIKCDAKMKSVKALFVSLPFQIKNAAKSEINP